MKGSLLVVCLLAVCIGYSLANCPDRWVTFQGSCYLFGDNVMHFTEAESFCRQHEGHLVEVGTQLENDFLRDFLHQLQDANRWMGMTDEIVEGRWMWFNNKTEAMFKDWGSGQPGNRHNAVEDCAIFSLALNYHWMDVSCTSNVKPVCEKT